LIQQRFGIALYRIVSARAELALRKHVPVRQCDVHVSMMVDADTGLAVGANCRKPHRSERKTVTVWPPAVRQYLKTQGRIAPGPPAYAKDCQEVRQLAPPIIRSPQPNSQVLLLPGKPASEQEIALIADVSGGGVVSWFVDGRFLGTVPADQPLWYRPQEGSHAVVAEDGAGQSARMTLTVTTPGR